MPLHQVSRGTLFLHLWWSLEVHHYSQQLRGVWCTWLQWERSQSVHGLVCRRDRYSHLAGLSSVCRWKISGRWLSQLICTALSALWVPSNALCSRQPYHRSHLDNKKNGSCWLTCWCMDKKWNLRITSKHTNRRNMRLYAWGFILWHLWEKSIVITVCCAVQLFTIINVKAFSINSQDNSKAFGTEE